jgi:peptidoglycan/xylan/chitin deacetylase (PgdA/CDA1 family)
MENNKKNWKSVVFLIVISVIVSFCILLSGNIADAASDNFILNPSMETVSATNPLLPESWYTDKSGNNSSTFAYPVLGMNNSKAIQIQMRNRADGWAGWFFNAVPVKPNTQYIFSDNYKSTVKSVVRAKYTLNTGRYSTVNLGTPSLSSAWKKAEYQFTPPAGAVAVTIIHLLNKNGDLTTDDYYLGEKDAVPPPPTPPSVIISTPQNNAEVSGLFDISATVANATNTSVQFMMDSAPIGTADSVAPFTIIYDSTLKINGAHTIIARLNYGSGQTMDSAAINVYISNFVPPPPPPSPSITINSPQNNAQVSGSFEISASVANASNTSVQFKIDNANIGAADTIAPFAISYDSNQLANGAHSISARLFYGSGLTLDSSPVIVNINNAVLPPPPSSDNLIQNPSFEEMDTSGKPKNWSTDIWQNNNAQFVYPVAGYESARAAQIIISSYTSGDAKWYFNDVAVTPGLTYEFSDYYMSDVQSNITFRFTNIDNTYSYKGIEDLSPSATWKKYTKNITIPANAKALTLLHIIESVGYLTVDNYYLKPVSTTPTPPPADPIYFNEGMATLSFDDARMSQYLVAYPYMQTAGIKGTFYPHLIDMNNLGTNSFYHPVQMLEMQSAGHEFGSHTRTHAHLTALSPLDLNSEVFGSRSDLLTLGASPVSSFCYPYGEFNPTVVQAVKDAGYTNARSVIYGYNNKTTDKYALLIQEVGLNTTLADAKGWINQAKSNKTWLILMFHQIDNTGNKNGTTPEIFKGIVDYLMLTNTKVVTIGEGVGMMN